MLRQAFQSNVRTFDMESINSYLARLWTSCNKRVYKSPIKIGD